MPPKAWKPTDLQGTFDLTTCNCIQCQLRARYGEDLDFLNEDWNDHIIGVTSELQVAYDAQAIVDTMVASTEVTREQAHGYLDGMANALDWSSAPVFVWVHQ